MPYTQVLECIQQRPTKAEMGEQFSSWLQHLQARMCVCLSAFCLIIRAADTHVKSGMPAVLHLGLVHFCLKVFDPFQECLDSKREHGLKTLRNVAE